MSIQSQIWIAHTANDPVSSFLHALEQTFVEDKQCYLDDIIRPMNDSQIYRILDPEDDFDAVSAGMSVCDFVVALISAKTNEEDLIAQLRRAHGFNKPILVLYYPIPDYGAITVTESKDLRELISGCTHVYAYAKNVVHKLLEFSEQKTVPAGKDKETANYDIFISHKSEDFELAKMVYDFLIKNNRNAFLSEISLPTRGKTEFMKQIDDALEKSEHMVVVSSKTAYLMSGWVEAEWRLFINEKRSGRKKGNIISVVADNILPSQLPVSLRQYEIFTAGKLAGIINYV